MKSKKGVSEIVSYVLLISISFAIAGMVFAWLRFYVTPGEEIQCDEGVSVSIREYKYNCSAKQINLTLKNDGRFNVSGFLVRVNNRTGEGRLAIYPLDQTGKQIGVGGNETLTYDQINNQTGKEIEGNITFIEVQPFIYIKGSKVFCQDFSKQKIVCSN